MEDMLVNRVQSLPKDSVVEAEVRMKAFVYYKKNLKNIINVRENCWDAIRGLSREGRENFVWQECIV